MTPQKRWEWDARNVYIYVIVNYLCILSTSTELSRLIRAEHIYYIFINIKM